MLPLCCSTFIKPAVTKMCQMLVTHQALEELKEIKAMGFNLVRVHAAVRGTWRMGHHIHQRDRCSICIYIYYPFSVWPHYYIMRVYKSVKS